MAAVPMLSLGPVAVPRPVTASTAVDLRERRYGRLGRHVWMPSQPS
jgi:hypothetical protein